jgi:hypothetical protein
MKVNGPEDPCPYCGRIDVPICPDCGHRVPHGTVVGTWLPCSCKGKTWSEDQLLENLLLEAQNRKS